MLGGLIYRDDFIELWIKLNQRGLRFISSKFHPSGQKRTSSSFQNEFVHSNWWILPAIQARMNKKITGDENISYEKYISDNFLKNNPGTKLISIGCGTGSHEIELAKLNPHINVIGYDRLPELISEGIINSAGIKNIKFVRDDINKLQFENNSVDYFLFHASLHHFPHVEKLLVQKIVPALTDHGLLILYEYVGPNRMNFPTYQIDESNKLLSLIPKEKRRIQGTPLIKSKVYRLGKCRMYLSDPSECVDAENILPAVHRHFETVIEKPIGGNLIMPALKHIAHNFLSDGDEVLQKMFAIEDEYLKRHVGDFLFGVYRKGDGVRED